MESIIISTKDNVSKFTYTNDEWKIETLYKKDNDTNNKIIKKTMDVEENNALTKLMNKDKSVENFLKNGFFSEHTNNILSSNFKVQKDEQTPFDADKTDKNIITLKPTVKPKAKAIARATKPKTVKDKTIVE